MLDASMFIERQEDGGEVEAGVMSLVVAGCPWLVATIFIYYITNLWILIWEFRMNFPLVVSHSY